MRNLRANQKRQKTKRSNAARFKGDGEGGLKRRSVGCNTVGPEACREGLGFGSSCFSISTSRGVGDCVWSGTQSLFDIVVAVVVSGAQPLESERKRGSVSGHSMVRFKVRGREILHNSRGLR